jgi:glutaredoxin 3
MQAEIWTKDFCPYCVEAKRILRDLNISYHEYKIGSPSETPQANQTIVDRSALLAKLPTARTVPQIWIDGTHVGGCTDLAAAVKRGDFSPQ